MHAIEIRGDVVTKRFRSREHGQPEREWRALNLLDEHAPGLAPRPLRADLDADPPALVMSRVEGVPLKAPVSAEQLDAMAAAITALQEADPVPVLGSGDGKLANYLWDGSRVRLVDFEYAGRSDRAYELAEVAEHVSLWMDGAVGASSLLSRFDLTAEESVRLRGCRRLLALYWLCALPPEALGHQVVRVLSLLDSDTV